MPLRPRPEIEDMEVCPHGGPDSAELKALGLTPDEVLDFSVCCNPYPPPAAVGRSLSNIVFNRYPDSAAAGFRECLSQRLGVSPENILAGSGTTELIRLAALTYLGQGDKVLIFKPTYGEYEVACQLMGARVIEHKGRVEEDFSLRAQKMAELIRKQQPRAVFICNPNNPTGQYLSRPEIDIMSNSCADSLLILDEAYVNFVDHPWSSLDLIRRGNVIILRSMTKDYSLAGLRLGYAVAGEDVIRTLRRACPPWNVSTAAQKAGIAALNADNFIEQSQKRIRRAKQYLVDGLRLMGLEAMPSKANFFMVKVGDGQAFRQALLKKGILVRDCASFGLKEYIRIAPRTMQECHKLLIAIREIHSRGE